MRIPIVLFCLAVIAGCSQNPATDVQLLENAAAKGDADAQFALGNRYSEGREVPKSYVTAADWYRKSAEQGLEHAQAIMGRLYSTGQGVGKDDGKAFEWYHRAAMQGNVDAQKNLGAMYSEGEGVPQDLVRAYAWYNLAARQQRTEGRTAIRRDELEKQLTPEQVAEAQKLSTRLLSNPPAQTSPASGVQEPEGLSERELPVVGKGQPVWHYAIYATAVLAFLIAIMKARGTRHFKFILSWCVLGVLSSFLLPGIFLRFLLIPFLFVWLAKTFREPAVIVQQPSQTPNDPRPITEAAPPPQNPQPHHSPPPA